MCDHRINRRQFTGLTTAGIAGGVFGFSSSALAGSIAEQWDPDRPLVVTGQPLKVKTVLMHTTYQRKEAASWRSWGRINTERAAAEEMERIGKELTALCGNAGFPLQLLPQVKVTSVEEALKMHDDDHDVVMIYPATGSGDVLKACFPKTQDKDALIFVRHQSGPTYYWYEALSTRYLKTPTAEDLQQNSHRDHGGVSVDDVVVDDYADVLWRLRALYGLKNFIGRRIVALGGPWGKYDPQAPKVAREKYRLDIIEVGYDDLAKRSEGARASADVVARAEKWTERYLSLPGTTLVTERRFVTNAFLLYGVFRDWMREHEAAAFTIAGCMSRVLPKIGRASCRERV